MKIMYSGIIDNGTRCAIITNKNGKEDKKAEKVIEAIENEGYKVSGIDWGDGTDIYVEVYDRDEYDELKEIYMEAKRA